MHTLFDERLSIELITTHNELTHTHTSRRGRKMTDIHISQSHTATENVDELNANNNISHLKLCEPEKKQQQHLHIKVLQSLIELGVYEAMRTQFLARNHFNCNV